MKTPLRYAGGKSKAYNIINEHIPFIPKSLFDIPYPERIVSPFMGGGSLESRWSSEKSVPVIGFDIFGALTNFWDVLLTNSDKLADKLSTLAPTQDEYNRIKEILIQWDYTQDMLSEWSTDHYKRESIELDNLTAAAYYFFNHNLSYGPMYLGWMSKIYQNQDRWNKTIERVRTYKNPNLNVYNGNFSDVIPEYKNDFLYLDPPYYLEKDEDNKMFKGIYPNSNIDVHHTGFDHELLRDLLHSHQDKFIMSYNNCQTIREYYKDFDLYYPSWHYSYGVGETRIGKNKQEVGNTPKESHEILIVKT